MALQGSLEVVDCIFDSRLVSWRRRMESLDPLACEAVDKKRNLALARKYWLQSLKIKRLHPESRPNQVASTHPVLLNVRQLDTPSALDHIMKDLDKVAMNSLVV